jgi:hypothetical protein
MSFSSILRSRVTHLRCANTRPVRVGILMAHLTINKLPLIHNNFAQVRHIHQYIPTAKITSILAFSCTKRHFKSGSKDVNSYKIIKTLTKYIWPKDDIKTRVRVLLALALLLGGKGILVCVPYLFKLAIDALTVPAPLSLISGAGALLIGYGAARITVTSTNCRQS